MNEAAGKVFRAVVGLAVDGVHQVAGSFAADEFRFIVDAGQRRAGALGEHVPIIVADHRHILRNA